MFTKLGMIVLTLCAVACGDSTAPTSPPVSPQTVDSTKTTKTGIASVVVVTGNNQTGTVNKELPVNVVGMVKDSNGKALAGQLVNFVVTSGGGSVFAGSAISTDSGIVREQWTLGKVAGTQQALEVRAVNQSSGQAITYLTFTANAIADTGVTATPDQSAVVVVQGKTGTVSNGITNVKDAYGNTAVTPSVKYSMDSGDTIASLTGTTVSGLKIGTTAIHATAGSFTWDIPVNVLFDYAAHQWTGKGYCRGSRYFYGNITELNVSDNPYNALLAQAFDMTVDSIQGSIWFSRFHVREWPSADTTVTPTRVFDFSWPVDISSQTPAGYPNGPVVQTDSGWSWSLVVNLSPYVFCYGPNTPSRYLTMLMVTPQ